MKSKEKRTAMLEPAARAAFCTAQFCTAPISVVIAARNEAKQLPRLLRVLSNMPEVGEIIVCDGQSSDETVAIARAMGAVVVEGARGRGAQQNRGAAMTTGEVLWFLHADALPGAKCGRQILRAVANGKSGGNFRIRFEARGVWPRFFETLARMQRSFGVYYGDSGIFVARETWQELSGFQDWPLFEDLDFARRLENLARREKQPTACCAGRLRVSARRFEKSPFRVLLWWLGLQIAFELGVSPHALARWYYGAAPKDSAEKRHGTLNSRANMPDEMSASVFSEAELEDVHAENQDELDAVVIEECGEALVDFLALAPTLVFAPQHPVFEFPRVHLLRESVAQMLAEAAQNLPPGLRLQIVEGYRPIAVQRAHFAHSLEEARKRFPGADDAKLRREAGRYSAPPDALTPPPHLTGGAVDLELIDKGGNRLDFTSPFDVFDTKSAAMNARGLSETAQQNRALLRSILEPTGLTNYADEWWHWSYGDNGWALRVGAPCAIYDKIELPKDAHWVGDLTKLPQ